MNYMDQVCGLLGLRLFEKFDIVKERPDSQQKIRNPYYFTDEGMINNFGVLDNELLADLIIGGLKIEKESPKDTNHDIPKTVIKMASKKRDAVTCLLDRMKEREEGLMIGSVPGSVNLETVRNVLLDYFNDDWVPVDEKHPQAHSYERLYLTIQYPNGHTRTTEGRYDPFSEEYRYPNQKRIKDQVLAWKKFRMPSCYIPE